MVRKLERVQLEAIGDNLVKLVREHRFSLEQLSHIVDVSIENLRKIMLGEKAYGFDVYCRIAKAFGISDYDLTGIKDMTPYFELQTCDWETIEDCLAELDMDSLACAFELLDELYDNIDEGLVEGNVDEVTDIRRELHKASEHLHDAMVLVEGHLKEIEHE